jgi:site-specific DNA recombinase
MQNDETSHRSIAIYCRVSTDEQALKGVSLEEQQTKLNAYCIAMGWEEDVVLFIDDGYSAKNLDRPQLKRLLMAVRDNEISKVMVTKLDRISRKLLDLLNLIEHFQDHNVSFISVSESFDTTSAPGRLTLQMLGAVAEFERERIRERVVDNMLHLAKKGKWLTQHPYGYRIEDKSLAIYEPEAAYVRKIYDWYVNEGLGFYAIAKQLNQLHVKSRFNKDWSLQAVKTLLFNPVYKGTVRWNRRDSSKKNRKIRPAKDWVVIENAVPEIVSEELWERAQLKHSKTKIPSRAQTSPHLLGGLLKCGNCGASLSISWAGYKENRHRVYRCSDNKNKGTCTSQTYNANELEELFKDEFSKLCLDIEQNISASLVVKEVHEPTTSEKLSEARKRYKRKKDAYFAGFIEIAELDEERKKLAALESSFSDKPVDEKVDLDFIEKFIKEKFKTIRDAFDILPLEKLKPLLHQIVNKVVVHDQYSITIYINNII